MTTYEIIMIMLTCLTPIISLLTLVVRLLLIIIDVVIEFEVVLFCFFLYYGFVVTFVLLVDMLINLSNIYLF